MHDTTKHTMHAVGLKQYLPIDDPQSLEDIELPIPQASGKDLQVKIEAISVNPVDTKVRAPKDAVEENYKVLGYDAIGTVEAVGETCSLFQPGDRVFYAGDITRQGSNSEYQLIDERIVGRAPSQLKPAEVAAMPLTSLTAWEALFERLAIDTEKMDPEKSNTEKSDSEKIDPAQNSTNNSSSSILIIGGAGGVGSIATQLASHLAGMTVVATASKEHSAVWCKENGASHVINHREDLAAQADALGINAFDYILCCSHTDEHFDVMCALIKPQGKICCIVDNVHPLPINKLKPKSASLCWEFMFTRAMFNTPDMIEQHHILNQVSRLLDEGVLQSTLKETLSPINAANLRVAHGKLERGEMMGKLVIEGWP